MEVSTDPAHASAEVGQPVTPEALQEFLSRLYNRCRRRVSARPVNLMSPSRRFSRVGTALVATLQQKEIRQHARYDREAADHNQESFAVLRQRDASNIHTQQTGDHVDG